jgi:hypothetical protein
VWRKLEIQWRKVEICWRKKINSYKTGVFVFQVSVDSISLDSSPTLVPVQILPASCDLGSNRRANTEGVCVCSSLLVEQRRGRAGLRLSCFHLLRSSYPVLRFCARGIAAATCHIAGIRLDAADSALKVSIWFLVFDYPPVVTVWL